MHLRVDIDFNVGLKKGVPYLLDLLDEFDAKATFFVVMGPDTLARHSRRVSEKQYHKRLTSLNLWKIFRHVGLAYLRSALLDEQVAPAMPGRLSEIVARGHQVGVHGFDHALWADTVFEDPGDWVEEQMRLAFESFARLMPGQTAPVWGAPNWRSCSRMFRVLERKGCSFSSDMRGNHPFYPQVDGSTSSVLQLPITLPTLIELRQVGVPRERLAGALAGLVGGDYDLLCIHGYYEGLMERALCRELFMQLRDNGVAVENLITAAQAWADRATPDGVERVRVPGGRGEVSCQRSFLKENYFSRLAI